VYYNPFWDKSHVIIPKKNGKGIEEYKGFWWRHTGHCRRCDNGKFHYWKREAGKPSGVILQRGGGIPHLYEDEIAPDEKPMLRRQLRARAKEDLRRVIREET